MARRLERFQSSPIPKAGCYHPDILAFFPKLIAEDRAAHAIGELGRMAQRTPFDVETMRHATDGGAP